MMIDRDSRKWLIDDVAEFLASCPSRKQLLAYRPSIAITERFNKLLAKSKTGHLSADEEWEMSQIEHLEMLIQSIKARLRTKRPVS